MHMDDTKSISPKRLYAAGSINSSNLGETIPDYRESLVRMMSVMAFTENSVAVGLQEFVPLTSGKEHAHVLEAIEDEKKHGRLVYELLEEIGVSRAEADSLALKSVRSESLRASIDWMKPGKSLEDLAVYSFLLDRAGNFHLRNYLKGSYAPWAGVCASILVEEEGHADFGFQQLKAIAETSRRAEVEGMLAVWYPKILDFFGRPYSPTTAKYIELGLKERDNEELRLEFTEETRRLLSAVGLQEPKLTRQEYPFCPD